MAEFDPGPPPAFRTLFEDLPDYGPFRQHFWFDWGPVFYRGRLDGSARVLCVASDPGPTERVAARTLVGDAGQRVQGFLTKIGLTRSYLCLNAFAYALFPTHGQSAPDVLNDPTIKAWRNQLFDAAKTSNLQAIVAFGQFAQMAVSAWPGKGAVPVFEVPHPSNRSQKTILDAWRVAVPQLRGIVTKDSDGSQSGANYGTSFKPADYSAIPRGDLPFGVPPWLGDDTWGRSAHPRHNNSVSRPAPDDRHTLIWIAPKSS